MIRRGNIIRMRKPDRRFSTNEHGTSPEAKDVTPLCFWGGQGFLSIPDIKGEGGKVPPSCHRVRKFPAKVAE